MVNPVILVCLILVWIIPLLIYFITGCIARGRSSSGQVTSKPMIAYSNFWYSIIIWCLIQGGLLILLIYPIYLKIFEC
jgi:hypothetical protein